MAENLRALVLGFAALAVTVRAADAQIYLGASGRVVTFPGIATPTNGVPATGPTVTSQEVTAFSAPLATDPYFEAKGIPLGGDFRLYPNLFTGVSYDDNVFRTPSAQASDVFFTVNPTVLLDYQTRRARADLYADADFFEYTKLTTVNTTNYDVGLAGGYEVSREIQVTGNVTYSLLSEPLSSPNLVQFQSQPSQYNLFDVEAKAVYKPNRLGLTVGASYDGYNFLSTPLFGGGVLSNQDRNNDDYRGFIEGSYDFSPGYSAYLRATYDNDSYQRYFDRTGAHRSSDGERIDAGLKTLLTNLIEGEVYIGYVQQNYNRHLIVPVINRPLSDISGLDFGANVTWYPTNLLTVHLGAVRQLENTTLLGASAGDDRNVNLEVDYAWRRNIEIVATAAYDNTDFHGTQSPTSPNRDDQTFVLGVGGKWLVSHYVYLSLNYAYSDRNSTVSSVAYRDNLFTLGINLQV